MKMSLLFVGEEEIRHPHTIGLCEREVLESTTEFVEFEAFVQPLLPEGQLDTVLLKTADALRWHVCPWRIPIRRWTDISARQSITVNRLCITYRWCVQAHASWFQWLGRSTYKRHKNGHAADIALSVMLGTLVGAAAPQSLYMLSLVVLVPSLQHRHSALCKHMYANRVNVCLSYTSIQYVTWLADGALTIL